MEHNHHHTRKQDKRTVSIITEHHCEEERESNNRVSSRVRLSIRRHTISVNDELMWRDHIISCELSRRHHLMLTLISPLLKFSRWKHCKTFLDISFFFSWGPEKADIALTDTVFRVLKREHIKCGVGGFFSCDEVVHHFELWRLFWCHVITVDWLKILSEF